MKLYKTKQAIVIENENGFYFLENEKWDEFINDDELFQKIKERIKVHSPSQNHPNDVLAPIGSGQELGACGVTYLRSKMEGRKKVKMPVEEIFMQEYTKRKGQRFSLKQILIELLDIKKK
ncbi:MAG TPA: hypothetical protein VIJ75_21130 [Hanamia sp.]